MVACVATGIARHPLMARWFVRHAIQRRIAGMPEALVIDGRDGGEARLVGQRDLVPGGEQHLGDFDFQAAFVLEIAPGAFPDLQRREIEARAAIDAEHTPRGHDIPALRVDEAADDTQLARFQLNDARERIVQYLQLREAPIRLLRRMTADVLQYCRVNHTVRPLAHARDAILQLQCIVATTGMQRTEGDPDIFYFPVGLPCVLVDFGGVRGII